MTTVTFDRDPSVPLANNPHLLRWVDKMRHLTGPETVHWVDGSQGEYDALCAQMVESGTLAFEWKDDEGKSHTAEQKITLAA